MTRRERDDDHFAATRADDIRADDHVWRIVSALHDDVRLNGIDQLEWRILLEHGDGADCLECGEDVRPFGFRAHRTIRAFQPLDRCVAVDADDEDVAA